MATLTALFFLAVKFTEIAPLVGTLLGGGIIGAAVQWRKSGAETDSIAAVASKTAIEVFEASIKQLKEDMQQAQAEAEKLTNELGKARKEIITVIIERDSLRFEVKALRKRVDSLEKIINDYENDENNGLPRSTGAS